MINVESLIKVLNSEFYVGVPDSQLKALCDYLYMKYGISDHHIIAANEGNAVGLAAGYYLATGKTPVVYMQNSGIGNAVNPIASLLNDNVYGIPCIFVIGWRGEPGVKDEPQHIFQGEITLKLLEVLEIESYIIDKQTTESELLSVMERFRTSINEGKSVAFVVRKGALNNTQKVEYSNDHIMTREEIIEEIIKISADAPVIATTGKASRELYELRERLGHGHSYDFLTVGSMGHSSSIAQAIAHFSPNKKIWCIDGDGAAIMHMGAMALAGSNPPVNLVHILINNEAHETVGGMPTVSKKIEWPILANACGYQLVMQADSKEELRDVLHRASIENKLVFIEIKAMLGSREDLGRPTTTAKENKNSFMSMLQKKNNKNN